MAAGYSKNFVYCAHSINSNNLPKSWVTGVNGSVPSKRVRFCEFRNTVYLSLLIFSIFWSKNFSLVRINCAVLQMIFGPFPPWILRQRIASSWNNLTLSSIYNHSGFSRSTHRYGPFSGRNSMYCQKKSVEIGPLNAGLIRLRFVNTVHKSNLITETPFNLSIGKRTWRFPYTGGQQLLGYIHSHMLFTDYILVSCSLLVTWLTIATPGQLNARFVLVLIGAVWTGGSSAN